MDMRVEEARSARRRRRETSDSTEDLRVSPERLADEDEVASDERTVCRDGAALAMWLWSDAELRISDDERQEVWLRLRDCSCVSYLTRRAMHRMVSTIVRRLRIDARRRESCAVAAAADYRNTHPRVAESEPDAEAERSDLSFVVVAALRKLPVSRIAALVQASPEIAALTPVPPASGIHSAAPSRKRLAYLRWDARRRLAVALQPFFEVRLRLCRRFAE